MLSLVGVTCLAALVTAVTVVSAYFLWRSTDITYNPCQYNVCKDDYRIYAIGGMAHSAAVALLTLFQLYPSLAPEWAALPLSGSFQILSLLPTMLYYHFMVINYKFRFLEVRNMGHFDYKSASRLDAVWMMYFILHALYMLNVLCAEVFFTRNMYETIIDELENIGLGFAAGATCLLSIDLFRIARNSYRNLRVQVFTLDPCHYWFRKYISQGVKSHFVSDFLLLFVPTQFLILSTSPITHLNVFHVLAKCLLVAHPIGFLGIYMYQIRHATKMIPRNKMMCLCQVCQDEKRRIEAGGHSWFRLEVMGSGAREDNGAVEEEFGEERIGGAAVEEETNVDEQPTETTPAMYTDQIRVSEDL